MKTFRFPCSEWEFASGDFLIPFGGHIRSVIRNWHLFWLVVAGAFAGMAGVIPIF